jgi:hypothetical protein
LVDLFAASIPEKQFNPAIEQEERLVDAEYEWMKS